MMVALASSIIGALSVVAYPKPIGTWQLVERLDSDGFAIVSEDSIVLFTEEGKRERAVKKSGDDKVLAILPSGDAICSTPSQSWVIRTETGRRQSEWLPTAESFYLGGLFFSVFVGLSVRSPKGYHSFSETFDRFSGLGVFAPTGTVFLLQPWSTTSSFSQLETFRADGRGGYSKLPVTEIRGPETESNSVLCLSSYNRLVPLSETEILFVGVEKLRGVSKTGVDLTPFPLSDPKSSSMANVGVYRANPNDGKIVQVATCRALQPKEAKSANYSRLQVSKTGRWLYLESYASIVRIPTTTLRAESSSIKKSDLRIGSTSSESSRPNGGYSLAALTSQDLPISRWETDQATRNRNEFCLTDHGGLGCL
jgi:hypothetical protein